MKVLPSLCIAAVIAASGLTARAAETVVVPKKHRVVGLVAVAGVNNPAAGGFLVDAYRQLETADHDYAGHRVRAMRQIEAAARLVGVNVHGAEKHKEAQAVSDEHMRSAQSLLEQAAGGLVGKPLHHVRLALAQLNTALNVR